MHIIRSYRLQTALMACLLMVGSIGTLFLKPQQAAAVTGSEFQASNIIDDGIFFNPGTMTPNAIQAFLNGKVPTCDTHGTQPSGRAGYPTRADWGRANGYPPTYTCLKDYVQAIPGRGPDAFCDAGFAGGTYSAAQIIHLVAQVCGVNPQVLLVTLQKEQSLVTDEWPWAIQYRSAMGYGCPDTAPCDAEYYGFFNQVYHSARQFKRYVRQSHLFNYRAGVTSFVGFNPNAACGGSHVPIQNGATAGLYNFTPYQPNAAALANLYGTGDGCSAYGNRNFWRLFNDWFGPTRGSFSIVKPTNSGAQYVLYNGTRFPIPSPDIITAWGFDRMGPARELDPNYLNNTPVGPTLGRLMRAGSWAVNFVDGGNRYRFPSAEAISAWGLNPAGIIDVPPAFGLFPIDQGNLSYAIDAPNDGRILLMDGGVLKQFGSPAAVRAWEGDNPKTVPLSTSYFSSLTISGAMIDHGYVQNGAGSRFIADWGRREELNTTQQGLFSSWTPAAVSDATIARLIPAQFSHIMRNPSNPTVYMVDGTQKHSIGSPELLDNWSIGGVHFVQGISSGMLDLLTTGSPVASFIGQQGTNYYLMSGQKLQIPASLQTPYLNGKSTFSASTSLLNLYNTGPAATKFLQSAGQPTVYVIDNGQKRPLRALEDYILWGGGPGQNTLLPPTVVNWYDSGSVVGAFVSAGGTNYLMNRTDKKSVSASVQTDWGLGSPAAVSTTLANTLTTSGALANEAKVGNGYYLLQNGTAYGTANTAIANLWEVQDATDIDILNIQMRTGKPLLRFARSADTNDSRIFAVDNGALYTMANPAQVFNYGYHGEPLVTLSTGYMGGMTISTALQNNIVRTSGGTYYAVDNGVSRAFSSTAVRDQWIQGLTIPVLSSDFLAFLPANGQITRSIRGGDFGVWAVVGGHKRHINSPDTYNNSYAPLTEVSPLLKDSLPTGAIIP